MSEKKTAEKADASSPAKKKPPMMIIVVAVALIALVGSFVVGKSVSAKGKEKKVEKGPVIVLDEFLVNLGDPGGDHFLKVTVGLELTRKSGKTAESMKEEIAPVRDAVLASLSSKTREALAPPAGREKLKGEIMKKVNDEFGEKLVQGVYFTNFVTQ